VAFGIIGFVNWPTFVTRYGKLIDVQIFSLPLQFPSLRPTLSYCDRSRAVYEYIYVHTWCLRIDTVVSVLWNNSWVRFVKLKSPTRPRLDDMLTLIYLDSISLAISTTVENNRRLLHQIFEKLSAVRNEIWQMLEIDHILEKYWIVIIYETWNKCDFVKAWW